MNDHEGWTVTYQKHFMINIFISFENLKKTSIQSPLNLRVSSVVKPSIFNLSLYPISDKLESISWLFLHPFQSIYIVFRIRSPSLDTIF